MISGASPSPTCRWDSTWGCPTRWDDSGSGPDVWDATARNDIRDAADGRARTVQILPEGKTELLTSEVARDAYPLATYFHAKQSYFILGWRETGGETVTTARHVPQRETRPITRSGATLTQ